MPDSLPVPVPARRADFEAALQRRASSFSVLVHSDPSSALVDFLPSSSVLQAGRHLCKLPLAAVGWQAVVFHMHGSFVLWVGRLSLPKNGEHFL